MIQVERADETKAIPWPEDAAFPPGLQDNTQYVRVGAMAYEVVETVKIRLKRGVKQT